MKKTYDIKTFFNMLSRLYYPLPYLVFMRL